MPVTDPIIWYERHATQVAGSYEALPPERLHGWLNGLMPAVPALVLDIGAGTGRDAAWFAGLGHDVVAVEPAAAMRAEATRLHPGPRIRWLNDRLPDLAATLRLGLAFDLVLLSAVWMHLAPDDRPRALRKLVALLKPGGLLVMTLRHGPAAPERGMHPVTLAELEQLARDHGLVLVRTGEASDAQGRADITWTRVALRLPDDGTGALPLLRHVILNDAKSSTYKLGLLRALCRIADGAAGLAYDADETHVAVPLGLVALTWLRLYLPLVRADLPQSPQNRVGGEKLSFAGPGFRALLKEDLSPLDLRVGERFTGARARALDGALGEAVRTISTMPARYMTYPKGGPVLPSVLRTPPRLGAAVEALEVDAVTLLGWGELRVPRHLWQALGRFACWIEPALINEWLRLTRSYATGQGRPLDLGVLATSMTWAEPSRDVVLPRTLALRLLERGHALHCVWSGKRLDRETLDIDHCLPWSAWPCGDLWNLLPTHRTVNQHAKRDRLPAETLLQTAREPIVEWWEAAYLKGEILPRRFTEEARASLPGLSGEATLPAHPNAVFAAISLQRLRLRHDQQVPEWGGVFADDKTRT
jgi:SAM-dependent methyltransferase